MIFEGAIEENSGIGIEYTYKGKYGEILDSGKTNGLDLNPIPEGTVEFDGYIRIYSDSFAYQGPIEKARELINKIKKVVELETQIANIKKLLFSEKRPEVIADLEKSKESLLSEIGSLENEIGVYEVK